VAGAGCCAASGRRAVAGGDRIERALALVRQRLRVTELVLEIGDGRSWAAPWAMAACPAFVVGAALPLADMVCERMLAGHIADLVPDVAAEPALVDLIWRGWIGANAELGVPIALTATRLGGGACGRRQRRTSQDPLACPLVRPPAAGTQAGVADGLAAVADGRWWGGCAAPRVSGC
jgi:hypothetical protein